MLRKTLVVTLSVLLLLSCGVLVAALAYDISLDNGQKASAVVPTRKDGSIIDPQNPTSNAGTPSQPTDVLCGANSPCVLSDKTSRKYLLLVNSALMGSCRIGYNVTPATNKGDFMPTFAVRTFDGIYVPQGPVFALCTVASPISVLEVN